MSLKKQAYKFLKELQQFDYQLSSLQTYWEVLFPTPDKKWHRFYISSYQDTFYIKQVNGENGTLEVVPDKSLKIEESFGSEIEDEDLQAAWLFLMKAANKWLQQAKKDWVATNLRTQKEYPLKYRFGTLSHSLLQATLPDRYRLDQELGAAKAQQFIKLVEDGFFMPYDRPLATDMTADKYFEYCKIAYVATEKEIDNDLSGQALYKRYADGRHEGLLDIDQESPQEFSDWLDHKHPKRERGGHPWEIKRGGSYTHIGMRVQRPSYSSKEGYTVQLYGQSYSRLADTIRMFLAIHEARLPIDIVEPESIRKRLLGQDKSAIIANYELLSRAESYFPSEEDICDALYYEDLGKFKKMLRPFIKWEALPLLRRKQVSL